MWSWKRAGVTALLLIASVHPARTQSPARNVVIITIDGLRWQEMFTGADAEYFKRNRTESLAPRRSGSGVRRPRAARDADAVHVEHDRSEGQIFGDPSASSRAHVTNGLWFSIPATTRCSPAPPIRGWTATTRSPNPNMTVLEWLNGRAGVRGTGRRVRLVGRAAVILNVGRSRVPVGSGFTPVPARETDSERAINELVDRPAAYWDYGAVDAPIVYAALERLRTDKPRVLYVMLGEGDEWAHQGGTISISMRHSDPIGSSAASGTPCSRSRPTETRRRCWSRRITAAARPVTTGSTTAESPRRREQRGWRRSVRASRRSACGDRSRSRRRNSPRPLPRCSARISRAPCRTRRRRCRTSARGTCVKVARSLTRGALRSSKFEDRS